MECIGPARTRSGRHVHVESVRLSCVGHVGLQRLEEIRAMRGDQYARMQFAGYQDKRLGIDQLPLRMQMNLWFVQHQE